MEIKKISDNTQLVVLPNEDEHVGSYITPKAVLQKSFIDKIGMVIDYCDKPTKVISVKISEKDIEIELEEL